MASGIKVNDDVKDTWQKINLTKSGVVKYKYAIFKYSTDGKWIEVEEKSESKDIDYDTLIDKLPEKEPRFLAVDFDHLGVENQMKSDVIMISWCPEGCPVRYKLIHGSSINGFKQALSITSGKYIEADTKSEITKKAVNEKFKWTSA